ncbi:MAG: inorganic diphosphatase, partial [Bacteroidota bacterium]|nr:inorganic diphosphatase [Bacteroidota bacterium]
MQNVLNPWHLAIGDGAPQVVRAVIEIPKGGSMKYELDKESGLLKLDRVIHSSMHYPMNYGLIPQTYFDDGDPLDILVICSMNIEPLCIVDARVIGIMHMVDDQGIDDKIISVAQYDPSLNHINDLKDIPQHHMNELKNFFEGYKALEDKKVEVGNMLGKEKGYECITRSVE